MQHDATLRLTAGRQQGALEIRVEGRLDGSSLRAMAELLATLIDSRGVVDLSGLTSADDAGRDVLAGLRDGGFTLKGASLYMRTLLEEKGT